MCVGPKVTGWSGVTGAEQWLCQGLNSGQMMLGLESWMKHLDFILKVTGSAGGYEQGSDVVKHTFPSGCHGGVDEKRAGDK